MYRRTSAGGEDEYVWRKTCTGGTQNDWLVYLVLKLSATVKGGISWPPVQLVRADLTNNLLMSSNSKATAQNSHVNNECETV